MEQITFKTADKEQIKEESEKNIETTCNIFQSYFEWDEDFLIDGVKDEAKIDGDHTQIKPAEKVTEHFKLSVLLGYKSFYTYVRNSIKEREDQKQLIKYLIMLKRFAVMLPTLDIYISSRMSKRQEPHDNTGTQSQDKENGQQQHLNTCGSENDQTRATMNKTSCLTLKQNVEEYKSITPKQSTNRLNEIFEQIIMEPSALTLEKRSSSLDKKVKQVQQQYEEKLLKKEQEILQLKKQLELKNIDHDFNDLFGYETHQPLFKFKYDKEILQMRHKVYNRLPISGAYPSQQFQKEKNHLVRVQQKNGEFLAFGGSILKGLQEKYKQILKMKGDKSYTIKIHIDSDQYIFNIVFEYHEVTNTLTGKIRSPKAPEGKTIDIHIKRLFKGPIVQYCNNTVWYDDENIPIIDGEIVKALNKARYHSSKTGTYQAIYSQTIIEPVDKEAFEAEQQAQQALMSAAKQIPSLPELEQCKTAAFGGEIFQSPSFGDKNQDNSTRFKSVIPDLVEKVNQKKEEFKTDKHYQALHKKVYSGTLMQIKSQTKEKAQQFKEQIKKDIQSKNIQDMKAERKRLQKEHKQKFKEVEETIVISKQRGRPYCILNQLRETQLLCRKEDQYIMFWNYLETFKSNFKVNYANGQFAHVEKLNPLSFEYKYVAYKFARSYISDCPKELRDINKAVKHMFYKTDLHDYKRIVCIEKIINPSIYQRVEAEFKRMLFTYQDVSADQIAKHLFISQNVNAEIIYNSYDGFNQQYYQKSHYGTGLYFSENARQCHDGAYAISDQKSALGKYHQMFLSLILVGRPALNAGKPGLTHPPLKPYSLKEHYDSIYQEGSGRYIVFDGLKVYPGYLITYT